MYLCLVKALNVFQECQMSTDLYS